MGRVQLFEVRLGHGRVVYSPGEPLAGAVRVRLGAPLPFRAIRVICTGSCRVSNKANDGAWVAEEGYFSSTLSLADKGSLPAGEHSFPFQFLLPATAPTSFEGPFGKIVHQVRANIDTPRFSKDHQCSCVFYILNPLNLNSIPDIEQPNVASTTKKFSYKLVKTGSVVLTASTDLRGYVVGQVLRLQADIKNQSGKDAGPVVASLLQKVSYKAKRWIYDVRTIAEVEGSSVKAWRQAQWQEQILVPALPQSALPGCSLIHVDYYLQVLGEGRGRWGGRAAWSLTHTALPGFSEGARSHRDPAGLHRRHRCEPRPAEPLARPRAACRSLTPSGALRAAAGRGGGRRPPFPGPHLPLHQEPLSAAATAWRLGLCAGGPGAPSSGWQSCPAPPASTLVHLHRCHCPLLCRRVRRAGAHHQYLDPPPRVQLVGLPL
ncbi:arrestin domain-containing protein 1 isoform X1 [Manis pentadactyla]|uniref:arrestin domain-containing protein 1 isoform X1 n=1 Tax=Manis pentadactyla TaxID=143292 RepID=UPI00255D0460|nr:arrestin domain-containing protein 1 isoform X1 [Manis pentadactyla]